MFLEVPLNYLLVNIKIEKQKVEKNIEIIYNKNLSKNYYEKDLVKEYFKINEYYRGLTLAQRNLFDSNDYSKQEIIESYINEYFSRYLFQLFLNEFVNK